MKTEIKNVIGERMKELRGAASQHQAAAAVGIKAANWNVYENGRSLPGARVIIKICQYYDVSADWLLGREPSKATVPDRASKTLPCLDARSSAAVLAELDKLKRRVSALENSQTSPAFACG